LKRKQKSQKLNHSPSSNAEKNGWKCTFTSSHIFAVWFLSKYRGVLTYTIQE
jgi:hypothetical protein